MIVVAILKGDWCNICIYVYVVFKTCHLISLDCSLLVGNTDNALMSPSGATAREEMMRSKLPSSVLRRVWALSDIDQDGQLDRDEFAVAMFLIDHKLSGNDLPDVLPDRLVPPSKRGKMRGNRRGGAGGAGRGSLSSGYSGMGILTLDAPPWTQLSSSSKIQE